MSRRLPDIEMQVALILGVIGAVSCRVHEAGQPLARQFALIAVTLVMFGALAWRRRAPQTTLIVVTVATVVIWLSGSLDGTTAVAGGFALYSLGRHAGVPRGLRVYLGVCVTLVVLGFALALVDDDPSRWFRYLTRCSIVIGPFWFGEALRSRQALTESYRERALAAERDRDERARVAVLDERARIAREMHDVVAHSLGIIVVQASLATRLVGSDDDRAAEAVKVIGDVGRTSLAEMRGLLGVLSDAGEESDLRPQPGLADLPALIEQSRSSALTIEWACETATPVTAASGLAVYRIVQESLANVLRHVGPTAVRIGVEIGAMVEVSVVDDGPRPPADHDLPTGRDVLDDVGSAKQRSVGSGRGVLGMRERVRALGGTLSAGPVDAGFGVAATWPNDAVAA